MPAVAVTDHGAMFGALPFFEAGRAAGVKPIIGVEAYVAPGSRFDRKPGESEEKYRHLTLLARNETGYRNLLKLVTDAHLEGFYHRPRIDKELLAEHAEGLICLSGCLSLGGRRALLAGRTDRAREVAAEYRDIFGPGQLLPRAPGPRPRRAARRSCAARSSWAHELGIPLVAHERPPLHAEGGREAARRPAVHPAAEGADATRSG